MTDCLNCSSDCIPISDKCVVVDGASLSHWYALKIKDVLCKYKKDKSCSNTVSVSASSVYTTTHPLFSSNHSKSISDMRNRIVSIKGNSFSDYLELTINTSRAENKEYNPETVVSIVGANGSRYKSKETDSSFALTYDMLPANVSVSVLHYTENGVVELSGSHTVDTSFFKSVSLNLSTVDKGYMPEGYEYSQYDFNKMALSSLSRIIDGNSFLNVSQFDGKMSLIENKVSSITTTTDVQYVSDGDRVTIGVADYYNNYLSAINALEAKIILLEQ